MKKCQICKKANSIIKRPKTGQAVCKACFIYVFQEEIHHTIISNNLFQAGHTVAIGASGGKDSTVLIHVLTTLNQRYKYGLNLILLSIDQGITGYRDDSLQTVQDNKKTYNLPLKILSYKDIYNWSMDQIVKIIGKTNNCTYCGVFRRQALDRGAFILGADQIATGHNADDIAETVLMNTLRGDHFRLRRCTQIVSGKDDELPRCKPLKYCYEKEIVMYAFHLKLKYFATECVYAPNAYRGNVRQFLKKLELIRPSAIIDVIHSGEYLWIDSKTVKTPARMKCEKCGFVSSNKLCKACVLLSGLDKMVAKVKVGYQDDKQQSKQLDIGIQFQQKKQQCCGKENACGAKENNQIKKNVGMHQLPAGSTDW